MIETMVVDRVEHVADQRREVWMGIKAMGQVHKTIRSAGADANGLVIERASQVLRSTVSRTIAKGETVNTLNNRQTSARGRLSVSRPYFSMSDCVTS